MLRETLVVLGLVALVAAPSRSGRADEVGVAAVDSTTLAKIEEIAKNYTSLGKVDDEARWAPTLCRAPNPSVARASKDHDGKKLFYVYAKDRDAYMKGESVEGQYVVKESYEARNVRPHGTVLPGKKLDLYIILRAAVKDSDDGWVYATVSPEGRVTAAGKIESCASCHKLAKNERLFGLDGKRKENP
jgi:hypothetical protein